MTAPATLAQRAARALEAIGRFGCACVLDQPCDGSCVTGQCEAVIREQREALAEAVAHIGVLLAMAETIDGSDIDEDDCALLVDARAWLAQHGGSDE